MQLTVDERFEFIKRFTAGVVGGKFLSFILVGDPGLGKSHSVIQTLKDNDLIEIEPAQAPALPTGSNTKLLKKLFKDHNIVDVEPHAYGDYIVIKGYSTPKALYRTLYENNGKIIIFDDCDGAFKHADAANILKGALDGGGKERFISWGSEKRGDNDVPQRFEFTGRVIFISNLALEDFPQAILSRAVHVDISMTVAEKIDRIATVMAKRATPEAEDVIRLVKQHGHRFKELSIRTAMLILDIRTTEDDPVMFEKMALYHAIG